MSREKELRNTKQPLESVRKTYPSVEGCQRAAAAAAVVAFVAVAATAAAAAAAAAAAGAGFLTSGFLALGFVLSSSSNSAL